jgi:hypothetical protein
VSPGKIYLLPVYIDMPPFGKRKLILGNLIVFGKVGIKILFTGKYRFLFYPASESKGGFYSKFYGLFIYNR